MGINDISALLGIDLLAQALSAAGFGLAYLGGTYASEAWYLTGSARPETSILISIRTMIRPTSWRGFFAATKLIMREIGVLIQPVGSVLFFGFFSAVFFGLGLGTMLTFLDYVIPIALPMTANTLEWLTFDPSSWGMLAMVAAALVCTLVAFRFWMDRETRLA